MQKTDNCVFIVGTSCLEAIIMKLVNSIASMIEESKCISEKLPSNIIYFVQKHGRHYFLFHLFQLDVMDYFQIQKITCM